MRGWANRIPEFRNAAHAVDRKVQGYAPMREMSTTATAKQAKALDALSDPPQGTAQKPGYGRRGAICR